MGRGSKKRKQRRDMLLDFVNGRYRLTQLSCLFPRVEREDGIEEGCELE